MDIRGGAVRPGQATWLPRLNPKASLVMRGGGHFIVDGQALDDDGLHRPAPPGKWSSA